MGSQEGTVACGAGGCCSTEAARAKFTNNSCNDEYRLMRKKKS